MDDPRATARSYYDALDEHDYATLEELLAPSFVHYRPDRTIDGRDRFVAFMRDERPLTDTSHPIDAVYADEDEVAVRGRLLDGTGEEITAFVDVFAFADGAVASIDTYTN